MERGTCGIYGWRSQHALEAAQPATWFQAQHAVWQNKRMDKKLATQATAASSSATALGAACLDLLGVSDFEWKVMATIYRHGSADAQCIADEVSSTLDVTLTALRRLAGLRAVHQGALGWICPDANLLTDTLAQIIDEQLAKQEHQLRQALSADDFQRAASASQDTPGSFTPDVYASWEEAVDASLFFGAQSLDLALSGRGCDFSVDSLSKWVALIQRRGLKVRVLMHADVANSHQRRLDLAPITTAAQEVRYSDHVLLDFAIVDGKTVASGSAGADSSGGRVAKQEVLVAASGSRFNDWWKRAEAFVEIPAGRPALSPMNMRVIQLLFSEENDKDRAASLGVSVRTFQRYVAHICDILGVRTRAEIATQLNDLSEVEK